VGEKVAGPGIRRFQVQLLVRACAITLAFQSAAGHQLQFQIVKSWWQSVSSFRLSFGTDSERRWRAVHTVLVIGVVVALLATGLVVGGRRVRASRETELRLAATRLQQEVGKERDSLVSAIERYKATLGCYPPDHVVSRNPLRVDPVTNQLMYELFGNVYNPTNGDFLPTQFPAIRGPIVKEFFNVDGFKNSVQSPQAPMRFLERSNVSAQYGINEKPDLVGVLGYMPNRAGMDSELYQPIGMPSWLYNSSAPIHNPGKFDLWIEIKTSYTNFTICNW
jgi:hypothetical protein